MLPGMMANVDFQKSDIIDLMVDKSKISKSKSTTTSLPSENVCTSQMGTPEASSSTPYWSNTVQAKHANEMSKMFCGLNTQGPTQKCSNEDSDEAIYLSCQSDLNRCLREMNN